MDTVHLETQVEIEPLILYFHNKSITVKKTNILNNRRPTVHRLELEEPRFGLPDTVIIKQEKPDGQFEFQNELATYNRLQPLQGSLIPTLYGQGCFKGRPALVLSVIEGITIRELAKNHLDFPEERLETQLWKIFRILHDYGAEQCDLNLSNLFCDGGPGLGLRPGLERVVVIDLEEMESPERGQSWEESVNLGSIYEVMSRFRDVRNPNRTPSPVDWTRCTGNGGGNGLGAPMAYPTIEGAHIIM